MIDADVCMHDPYSCEQLLYLERLTFNTFNTTDITTFGFMVINFMYFRIFVFDILITSVTAIK
jgi:hypothetical protein